MNGLMQVGGRSPSTSASAAPAARPAGFPAFLKRPEALPARAALVAVNLAAVMFFLSFSRHGPGFGPYRIDLDVYRSGGRVWLNGGDLYGRLSTPGRGPGLPFTYPPIAAILLSPLSLVPMAVASMVLTMATIALLGVVLRVVLRRLAGPGGESLWRLAWLMPAALFLEPVRNTLGFGQINVLLMALVSLDCLAEAPRWPRGALTGLAAAVKLTPAVFVLFFLLRRDFRAAGTAAASFAAATGVGFVLAWHDSIQYWADTVFHPGRIGNVAYASNQCLQAVLARAGLHPQTTAATAAWAALSAVVFTAACGGMRHALAASQDCWALSLNAFAALLISPVSWSHHWVWGVPAMLTLGALGRRYQHRLALATAATGLAAMAAAPQWWFPRGADQELHWAVWQQATGSFYVLFAVAALLLSACGKLTPREGRRASPLRPGG